MKSTLFSLGLGLALSLAAAPTTASTLVKHPKKLLSMTPEQFQSAVTVADDDLETIAVLSTEKGFKERRGAIIGSVLDDNYLRAYIDKKTGETKYELHQWIRYNGGLRRYYSANYATPDGPKSKDVTVVARNAGFCPDVEIVADCNVTEHVKITVDESLLRTIAANYRPNGSVAWRFKLKAENSKDWQESMMAAEIAGLLRAVDAYKTHIGISSPSNGSAQIATAETIATTALR